MRAHGGSTRGSSFVICDALALTALNVPPSGTAKGATKVV